MSSQPSSEPSPNATSLPASEAGRSRLQEQVGLIIARFGREAVLASLSPRQAASADLLTSGTCGPTGTISSRSAALQQSLESRLRPLLTGSDLCEVIWKPWTTPWGQCLSKPRARVRTISGTGSGLWQTMVADDAMDREGGKVNSRGEPKPSAQALWATIRASDGEKGGPNMKFGAGGQPLPAMAAQSTWATPASQEPGGTAEAALERKRKAVANGKSLGISITHLSHQVASAWPTPTSRDHKDGPFCPNVPVNGLLGRMVWPTPTSLSGGSETSNPPGNSRNNNKIREHALAATWPTARANESTGAKVPEGRQGGMALKSMVLSGSSAPTEKRGALNPEFVCWLMGYPAAWVSCGVLAMQSIRDRRQRSSKPRAER